MRCEPGPAPRYAPVASCFSKSGHGVRYLAWVRWPGFHYGWLAAPPGEKVCEGHWIYVGRLADPPGGHVTRIGPVGMSCENEVGWCAAKGKN